MTSNKAFFVQQFLFFAGSARRSLRVLKSNLRRVMFAVFGLIALVAIFTFFVDSDFITYFHHLYRIKYNPKCMKGKTLWIVGASSGLGEQIAYRAAVNDAKCVIISSRRKEQLQRVAENLNAQFNSNTKVIIAPLDILQFVKDKDGRAQCETFIRQMIQSNNVNDIDYLVMNSGVTARGLGINTELNVLERLFNLNVFGIIVFVQSYICVLRELKWLKASATNKPRGVYVTSSTAGLVGSPGQPPYAASKHAINGFMKSLRYELVTNNVHIGIVNPGPFKPSDNSNDGMGETVAAQSGRLLKNDIAKKKMTAERASQLYLTVIRYRITEAWLANNPILIFIYIMQYLPCLEGIFTKYIGPKRMKKILHKKKK
eukprot:30603_1